MFFCKMQKFPLDWEIPFPKNCAVGPYISERALNDDWRIVCNWNGCRSRGLELQTIQICRRTTSEEMSIFGTLSLISTETMPTQEFSKLIKPGSSSIIIHLSYTSPMTALFPFIRCFPSHILRGTVCIASSTEKYSGDPAYAECNVSIQTKSLVQLSNDFERLLDPEDSGSTDVNLKCGYVSIPAHKIILSTRSPVFAAMFDNEMREIHENQVNITDVDASVVRAMVTYIYAGKTSNLTVSSASDLLFAADKYQLEDLKRVCCDFLKQNVSLQNVLRILVVGDMHAEDLKSFALDYICNKCADFSVVEGTKEWKTLRKERAGLAMDVLTSLVKSRDQKSKEVQANPALTGVQRLYAERCSNVPGLTQQCAAMGQSQQFFSLSNGIPSVKTTYTVPNFGQSSN